jgi:hypothetical protein
VRCGSLGRGAQPVVGMRTGGRSGCKGGAVLGEDGPGTAVSAGRSRWPHVPGYIFLYAESGSVSKVIFIFRVYFQYVRRLIVGNLLGYNGVRRAGISLCGGGG